MNVSIAMITKVFDENTALEEFLDNAQKYNHKIYSVIIVYSHKIEKAALDRIQKKVKVYTVKINGDTNLYKNLLSKGMNKDELDVLLKAETLSSDGIVPYGKNRNHALLKAFLTGTDILFFIDTDVYPYVLRNKEGTIVKEEIDFIGSHLEYLQKNDVILTTSDYSGYYIIPPMAFNGLKELLIGIQKGDSYNYLKNCTIHNCLNLGSNNKCSFETNKLLGGNLAIKLSGLYKLPPFYSSYYSPDGKKNVLARGEDTVMGLKSREIKEKFIDIDVKIFHDTFENYPKIPDIINDPQVKERFLYACLGWIGRNPFLNWINDRNIKKIKKYQFENLKIGAPKLSSYLNDERFLILPQALIKSYENLPNTIEEYKGTLFTFKKAINLM